MSEIEERRVTWKWRRQARGFLREEVELIVVSISFMICRSFCRWNFVTNISCNFNSTLYFLIRGTSHWAKDCWFDALWMGDILGLGIKFSRRFGTRLTLAILVEMYVVWIERCGGWRYVRWEPLFRNAWVERYNVHDRHILGYKSKHYWIPSKIWMS